MGSDLHFWHKEFSSTIDRVVEMMYCHVDTSFGVHYETRSDVVRDVMLEVVPICEIVAPGGLGCCDSCGEDRELDGIVVG